MIRKIVISAILLFGTVSLFSANYSAMNTDELMELRGNIPVEDIEAFGTEISKRVQKMNDQDLRRYGIWEMIRGNSNQSGAGCDCAVKKKIYKTTKIL